MRQPVRILAFFLHFFQYGKYVGGSQRRFLEISTHLSKLGVETFALEYHPSLSEEWGYSGYHSIEISRRFINHEVLETIRIILHGIKACIRSKCDMIYVPHRIISTNLVSAYVISLLCRKPLVIVFHHLTLRDYSCQYYQKITRLLAHQHAEACLAVSQATANNVEKAFRVRRLVITTNGVNLNIFNKIKPQTKIYDAVSFGRMLEQKGVFTLLEAWKIVITQIPSAQLLLLGGTTEYVKHVCTRTINKFGLSRNVIISGFVSDQEAVRLLKSSRTFVFPSRAEGFGLVVAEAMAAGLPCILSNLPVLKENFHSAAVFVEPKNVEGLAQAILTLLSDPEKCRKLKKRGQRLVKRFSWEAAAKKELELFRSVIKSARYEAEHKIVTR